MSFGGSFCDGLLISIYIVKIEGDIQQRFKKLDTVSYCLKACHTFRRENINRELYYKPYTEIRAQQLFFGGGI